MTSSKMQDILYANPYPTKTISVLLNFTTISQAEIYTETDIIRNLKVNVSSVGDIKLQNVLIQLKWLGYGLNKAKIQFYSNLYKEFVCCHNELQAYIVKDEELENGFLLLKCEIEAVNSDSKEKSLSDTIASLFEHSKFESSFVENRNKDLEENSVRTRDSTISSILLLVKEWRDLYVGYTAPDGKRIKCTLEEAAAIVNMSKKTLDDYLQQIKKAAAHNFDFNKHRDKQIGYLRNFVKENESSEKRS